MHTSFPTNSVQEIFDLARDGNETALSEFLERLRPQILTFCYRLIGRVDDAEDATQEALIGILEAINTPVAAGPWQNLVYRSATTAGLDSLRESREERTLRDQLNGEAPSPETMQAEPLLTEKLPLPEVEALEHRPGSQVDTRESLSLVFVNVLQILEPEARAVYLLKDVLGCSLAELTDATSLSPSEVAGHLQLAERVFASARQKIPATQLLPANPNAIHLLDRLGKLLLARDPSRLLEVFAEDSVLVFPRLGSFFGPEAIATQFARMFEVGLAPHATATTEINGQPTLVCLQQRQARRGFKLYPSFIMVLAIAARPPDHHLIVRVDVITDPKSVMRIGETLPQLKASPETISMS